MIGTPLLLAPRKSFIGQVGSRSFVPTGVGASTSTFMTRTAFYMRARSVPALQICWPNWFVDANNGTSTLETTTGVGTLTISGASIEYPAGVFHRCLFNGSSSIALSAGATQFTDPCVVAIPPGALAFVRARVTSTTGPVFGSTGPNYNTSLGDALQQTNTDLTMTGTVTDGGFGGAYFPCAIVGRTTASSFAILGDSRATGVGDVTVDSTGDTGELMRGLGGQCPVMNLACPGEMGSIFAANATRRTKLMQYVTHIGCAYGINDIEFNSQSSAQVQATITNIAALASQKVFFQLTLSPVSNSTDSWATTANQTTSVNNSTRVSVNTAIRSGTIQGIDGVIEIADLMETSRGSGIWNVTGVANGWTADGLHGNTHAMLQIILSKALVTTVGGGSMPQMAVSF